MIVSVEEAIEEIRNKKMLIVTDSADRENEGDIVFAAEDTSPEWVNFLTKHARGLICVPLSAEYANRLDLAPMVVDNRDFYRTAFTVSVDAYYGTTTGISAFDRCLTIQLLANPQSRPQEFRRPGHIFPLIARSGGSLVRAGHTEASVDLMQLAGKNPAAVICEIMNEDGSMARMPDLLKLAEKFNLKILTIESLIEYRLKREALVEYLYKEKIQHKYGEFELHFFQNRISEDFLFALTMGSWMADEEITVRMHSEDYVQDVFSITNITNKTSIDTALRKIAELKKGVLVFLPKDPVLRRTQIQNYILNRQKEQANPDLPPKDYPALPNDHSNVEPEQLRHYGIGAQILKKLNVHKMKLITQRPKTIVGLEAYDLNICGTLTLENIH